MGRPSKRTDAREAVVLTALRAGMTRTDAAEAAGIARSTLNDWISSNPTFSDALTKAEADAVLFALGRINKAAREAEVVETFDRQGNLIRRVTRYDWRAAAWWMEHSPSTRNEWGPNAKVEVSGPDGGAIEHSLVREWQPDDKWLADFARIAAEVGHHYDDGSLDDDDLTHDNAA